MKPNNLYPQYLATDIFHIDVKFVSSVTGIEQCPKRLLPEYAFIGRSNVGKSSLVNMLLGRHNLAFVSSRPGKTETINHYEVNNTWYLVDLPGYGYSSKGKKKKELFSKIIEHYIIKRATLTCLFVLVDIRHEPQKVDLDFFNWVIDSEIPMAIVFTKSDKLSKSQVPIAVKKYSNVLLQTWEYLPQIFVTSAQTEVGRENLLNYIDKLNHTV